MGTDYLLSDEFVEFSKKVAELHTKKKEKEAAFKSQYEAYKADMADIDKLVKQLQADFEAAMAAKSKKAEK